jgi:RNA polymerase sigma factor (TIGR02999 family)
MTSPPFRLRRCMSTSSEPPLSGQGPPAAQPDDVTGLLLAWGEGDPNAINALLPIVYAELHRQAERAMRHEVAEHTLQPTALVHEAYLRLVDHMRVPWQNRAQFFGIAARCMRRVLVDHARARGAAKRGGPGIRASLDDASAAVKEEPAAIVVAVHEALERLSALDEEQARLVELRYFGGLTIEETAAVLGISPATVKREWVLARAWLRRELREPSVDETRP